MGTRRRKGGDGHAVAGVDDPSGKHAIEQGLDQSGAEEVFALFALEVEAEGGFEGSLDGREGGEVAVFDAGLGFAGVGGQEAGDILRSLEGGVMGQNALEIFFENGPQLHRHFLGVGDGARKDFSSGASSQRSRTTGLPSLSALTRAKARKLVTSTRP
jgi:hypothetical protein